MALTTYTAGEVLTAASLNANLTFAAANPVASPAGVVQVVSTTKTDTFSLQSATFTDVTDFLVSITPTSATNKILIAVSMMTGNNTTVFFFARLMRDSTPIAVGDAAGNRAQVTGSNTLTTLNTITGSLGMSFLDSPATTSAVEYKVQVRCSSATANIRVNRSEDDADSVGRPRGVSTITVMEVTA